METNNNQYQNLPADERAFLTNLDEKMGKITQEFAYDLGKTIREAQQFFSKKGNRDNEFTFTKWVQSWGITKTRAYNLMDFSAYVDELKEKHHIDSSKMIETLNTLPKGVQNQIIRTHDEEKQSKIQGLLNQKVEDTQEYKRILDDFYSMRNERDELQAKNQTLLTENVQLQSSALEYSSQQNELHKQLVEVQEQKHRLEAENLELRNQEPEVQIVPPDDYADLKASFGRLQSTFSKLTDEKDKLSNQLRDKDNEIQNLKNNPGAISQSEVDKLVKQRDDLLKANNQLQSAYEEVKSYSDKNIATDADIKLAVLNDYVDKTADLLEQTDVKSLTKSNQNLVSELHIKVKNILDILDGLNQGNQTVHAEFREI